MPSLRLTLMMGILLTSLCIQLVLLPWKAPVLNLVDGVSVSLLVMLLAVSLGYSDNSQEGAEEILAKLGTFLSICTIGIIALMCALGASALFYRSAMGGQGDLWLMNLGRPLKAEGVFESLADVAKSFTDGRVLAEKNIADLDKLCVYDLGLIQRAMGILMDDVEIVSNSRRGSLARITSGKSRDRQTQSNAAKSTESNEKANANGDPSDEETKTATL